jgi:hypothetical protein
LERSSLVHRGLAFAGQSVPVYGTQPAAPATARPARRNSLQGPRRLLGQRRSVGDRWNVRRTSATCRGRFEWSDTPRLVATDVTGWLRSAPSPGGPLVHRRERYCHLRRRHLRLAGAVQMAINRDYSVTEGDEPPPKRTPTTMSRPARLRPGGRHLRPRRGQPGREPAPPCRLRGQRHRRRVQDHARDRELRRFDVLVCRLAPSRA